MKYFLLCFLPLLAGCGFNLQDTLSGADLACGQAHVEGYFTDSQAEVILAKIPDNWTVEDYIKACPDSL